MLRPRLTTEQILTYGLRPSSQSTVRRAYEKWRASNGMVSCCDNLDCVLHGAYQIWNSKPISMILDHIDGNRKNNRPDNLRFLCPNCDSQLATRGGKNKGRIRNATGNSYHVVERDGQTEVKVMLQGQTMTHFNGMLITSTLLSQGNMIAAENGD